MQISGETKIFFEGFELLKNERQIHLSRSKYVRRLNPEIVMTYQIAHASHFIERQASDFGGSFRRNVSSRLANDLKTPLQSKFPRLIFSKCD